MKKLNKYLLATFAAVLSAGLFSCVEEAPAYEPGEPDLKDCKGVYFPTQDAAGDHTFDPTMDKVITITAVRANAEGEAIVPVTAKASEEGIFNVGELKFADGQTETTFDVTFPEAQTAVKYTLALSIDDPAYASLYNDKPTGLQLSVFCVEWNWFMKEDGSEKALFTFEETLFEETHQFYLKYYEVDGVRHCVTVSEPYLNAKGTYDQGIWGSGADYELEFEWYPETDYIFIPYQTTGIYNNDETGYIHVCCEAGFYERYRGASYYTSNGYASALDWLIKNYPDEVCYYDGHGTFELFTYYVCDQNLKSGSGYSFGSDESMIADGYTRVDYSIDVEAGETFDGVVPVTFELGVDVTSVKYVVAEGSLGAKDAGKLADAIIDGSVANIKTLTNVASPYVGVSADSTGVYTLVAVSYAAEEAQESTFTNFCYVAAGDEVPVFVSCGLTCTGKYEPVGKSPENNLEYYVYGSDLTSVKLGIYTAQEFAGDQAACIADVRDMDPVPAEVLESINADGYVGVVGGLTPGTEYYLLVWASNGYQSKVIAATATTAGDPLPIYMNYTMDDIVEDLIPEKEDALYGTYNLYAIDMFGKSTLRDFIGTATITDSPTPNSFDEEGYEDQYVVLKGLAGPYASKYGFEDAVEFDFYGGSLYANSSVAVDSVMTVYTINPAGQAYSTSYIMFFDPVAPGYWALFNSPKYESYGFAGFGYVYDGSFYAAYTDYLLVDPKYDDNGVAPASAAPARENSINFAFANKNLVGDKHLDKNVKSYKRYSMTPVENAERSINTVAVKAIQIEKPVRDLLKVKTVVVK